MVALILMILCAALLAQAYIGYPLLLMALAALRRPIRLRPARDAEAEPTVSIVFSAHNEAAVLAEKLNNCLSLDYPPDRLEVVVANDASDDGSDDILRQFEGRGVRWLRLERRQGKNAALNHAAGALRGEIWVFTDANAMFEPDALRRLTAHFADPRVGLVCGELNYGPRGAARSAGQRVLGGLEAVFWRFDQTLKRLEGRFGCLVGANGGIFAIRRREWRELDLGAPNDFMLCALAAARGAWTIYEPAARAWEAPSERVREEFDRRARIITRGLRALSLVWKPAWRGRRSMLLYGMISRKWLRRLQPVLLAGLMLSNLFLLTEHWARWTFAFQTAGYGVGLLSGLACVTGARSRALLAPFYFLALNAAAAVALWRFALGKQTTVWSVQRAEGSKPPVGMAPRHGGKHLESLILERRGASRRSGIGSSSQAARAQGGSERALDLG